MEESAREVEVESKSRRVELRVMYGKVNFVTRNLSSLEVNSAKECFARKVKAIAINPNFKDLNQENIKEIQSNGFKVFPYTINELDDIERMIKLGVDAIITDYPERVNK